MLTDTRLCHLCERVQVPLSSFFCVECFSIIQIGRLVRKALIPHGAELTLIHKSDGYRITLYDRTNRWRASSGNATIEQALETVGVKFLE